MIYPVNTTRSGNTGIVPPWLQKPSPIVLPVMPVPPKAGRPLVGASS